MQRRYEEARKLASKSLGSGQSRDLDDGASRVRDGRYAETWGIEKFSPGEDRCDLLTVRHVDECACYYAQKLHRLTGEQEEFCKTALDEDFDPMEGSCSRFADIGGRFKFSLLQHQMNGVLQSCSASKMNTFSLRTGETIQNVDRQSGFPCSGQICDLLQLLKSLESILNDILNPGTVPSNRANRKQVSARVYKGYSPKASRLMVYNNISVVPATQYS